MSKTAIKREQMHELLYQALETEIGGIDIYQTAISCARNAEFKEELEGYLEETRHHHEVLLGVFKALGLDPGTQTPGRKVVAHLGRSLVQAMEMAKASGDEAGAELVAGECVVLAETKDHQNWELIGELAEHCSGDAKKVLQDAYDEVEEDEHHHLYHTRGWTRELWIESLGMPAVLPPPEEVKHVETAIGASRAEQAREKLL